MNALFSPHGPIQGPPPHITLITCQGKRHARITTFRVAALCWRNVSLAFRKIFSPFTRLVLPLLLTRPDSVIPPPHYSDAPNVTHHWVQEHHGSDTTSVAAELRKFLLQIFDVLLNNYFSSFAFNPALESFCKTFLKFLQMIGKIFLSDY